MRLGEMAWSAWCGVLIVSFRNQGRRAASFRREDRKGIGDPLSTVVSSPRFRPASARAPRKRRA